MFRFYRNLSPETRTRIRTLVPGSVKRWYAHRSTDVYLISYPKCGRTWLRLMLGSIITRHYSLPQTEENLFIQSRKRIHPDVPSIAIIHEDSPMIKRPDELQTDKSFYKNKKVIFLSRDPRDVLISSYFEVVKRQRLFAENPHETPPEHFSGTLSEFIHKKTGGFDTILAYYAIWERNRHVPENFLLARYEDLKSETAGQLRIVLDFLGLFEISQDEIEEAVAFATFENMQKMESEGRFQSEMLKPGDKKDLDSYKTRKGVSGGYIQYLSAGEITILNQKMKKQLPDFFGYTD